MHKTLNEIVHFHTYVIPKAQYQRDFQEIFIENQKAKNQRDFQKDFHENLSWGNCVTPPPPTLPTTLRFLR